MITTKPTLEKKVFETEISVKDPSGDFLTYWNVAMKEQLGNHFAPIGLQDLNTGLKPLTNFHLKLVKDFEGTIASLFTIEVIRIKTEEDYSPAFIQSFKEQNKTTNLLVLLINVQESSESSVKTSMKFMEKMKKELSISELSFVPYANNITGPIYSSLENFFKDFKMKLSLEFNKKINGYMSYFDRINEEKRSFNSEDEIYLYLKNKYFFINYLSIAELWTEVLRTINDDLFKLHKQLNKPFPFIEPFSVIDFNDSVIFKKILEQNLSNLEYQQFLIITFIRTWYQMKEYKKLNIFYVKCLQEISSFNSSFDSMFHFYFWNYQLNLKLLKYIEYLENKNIMFTDEERISNLKGKMSILYFLKKILKNYAFCSKIEIPNEKILTLAMNCEDQNEISSEMNSALNAINEDIENNTQYGNFKEDIKEDFDEKLGMLFTHQKTFFEEFLKILTKINDIHNELNQSNLALRVTIEQIPIWFALSRFDEVKMCWINIINSNIVTENNWEYIYEYLNFALILLWNCWKRTDENWEWILKCIDVKMRKIINLIKIVDSDNSEIVSDIISKYIDGYNLELQETKYFNMNNIIDIKFSNDNNVIYINQSESKIKDITCVWDNHTGFYFNIDKIKLVFEQVYCGPQNTEVKEVEYFIEKSNSLQCIEKFTKNKEIALTVNSEWRFEVNGIYNWKNICFYMKNGVCGLFKLVKNTVCLNIKTINTEVKTQVYPSCDINENEILSKSNIWSTQGKDNFYYNTLQQWNIRIINLPQDMSDKEWKIDINDIDKQANPGIKSNFKIASILLQKDIVSIIPKISITATSILFPANSLTTPETISLLSSLTVPYIIEDSDFYDNGNKTLLIKTTISNTENTVLYSFIDLHKLTLKHLFSLNNKFRLMKNGTYLMQNTFSLNEEWNGIKVYLSNENNSTIHLDTSQAVNIVLNLTKNKQEIKQCLSDNIVKFTVPSGRYYNWTFLENDILEEIDQMEQLPYHINIATDTADHKVFEELSIKVKLNKYVEENVIIMLKIRENENWSVIGKTKIIETLKKEDKELSIDFKWFPLVDGYIKIPDIELMEYTIPDKSENEDVAKELSINSLDFNSWRYGSIIEGNERIIKINTVNSCTLRLNLT